ncbi:MAG: 2-C-methyl-D-erythritol 4-phosphate cytidylyltransferase, partial [Desulfosudaceae bacterium]
MVSAIIVAGGRGTRLPGPLPKQYLPLAGKPLLAHTLAVFAGCGRVDEIVLVVPAGDRDYCRDNILPTVPADCPLRLAAGGEHRQESVYNGLRAAAGQAGDQVLIHDGVRPLVTADLIGRCLDGLAAADGCVAAVPASDTLKSADPEGYIIETVDRSAIWLAQTPQAFAHATIFHAHQEARKRGRRATDDAALVERTGRRV